MILLSVNEIILLHNKLILKTGGLNGIRDKDLLFSAIASINASFDDVILYKSVEEKSARLAFAVISNHAFLDGNKRIGILAMLLTLKLNNIFIKYNQKELIFLGLAIADKTCDYKCILNWILTHKIN